MIQHANLPMNMDDTNQVMDNTLVTAMYATKYSEYFSLDYIRCTSLWKIYMLLGVLPANISTILYG